MSNLKLIHPVEGFVGNLCELKIEPGTVLVVQLPRESRMLSENYISHARSVINKSLPEGTQVLLMGCDVDIYQLCEIDAVCLKLKGIIGGDNTIHRRN